MQWHCPICQKLTDSERCPGFPFCSERCRILDLGNWATEKYLVSEPVIDEPMPQEPSGTIPDESKN